MSAAASSLPSIIVPSVATSPVMTVFFKKPVHENDVAPRQHGRPFAA